MKRDILEQRAYAEHRMVLAIERILVARTDSEREKASKWTYAWRDFSQGPIAKEPCRVRRISAQREG